MTVGIRFEYSILGYVVAGAQVRNQEHTLSFLTTGTVSAHRKKAERKAYGWTEYCSGAVIPSHKSDSCSEH